MRHATLLLHLLCIASISPLPAQTTTLKPPAGSDQSTRIPIKRVVLYKNGVGYFEHLGKVTGNQQTSISFTPGQLNDALKSLTVLDLGGGAITGVSYGSEAPLERRLGELQLAVSDKPTLVEFLSAMRGAKLEVRNGTSVVTGRLLSIERKTRVNGGTTLEVDFLSLLTDSGEVRTSELSPAFSVRLLEGSSSTKLKQYLDLLSSARQSTNRKMVISSTGSGERPLFVSYISEVPVWKTTYRIVLPEKSADKPLLQGWAIVDNTVGEDWSNVELSLVAGAPQSFIQRLSDPVYARRPVVDLSAGVSLTPQTHEGAMYSGQRLTGVVKDPSGATIANARIRVYDGAGRNAGETTSGSDGRYFLIALSDGEYRVVIDSPGFNASTISGIRISGSVPVALETTLQVGGTSETVTVSANVSALQTSASSAMRSRLGTGRTMGTGSGIGGGSAGGVGSGRGGGFGPGEAGGYGGGAFRLDNGIPSAAQAQELGDLFEYKVKDPISILSNQSAMVPIINASFTAEKVSLWNPNSGDKRPRRALWLTNTTDLVLDNGSFSVLEQNAFAGEGLIDSLRPGEKRLVSYAADLALTVTEKQEFPSQRISQVRCQKGVMIHQSEAVEKRTYLVRNNDAAPRNVLIEHPARSAYQLRNTVEPAETTAAWMRFRLNAAPSATSSLTVEEYRPNFVTYTLGKITPEQVEIFVRDRTINPQIEDLLRRILAQKGVISDLDTQQSSVETETTSIFEDQQRLRENLKSLKGSAEEKALTQRYTQQLNRQEDRLAELQKRGDELAVKKEAAQKVLDEMIESAAFDVKL